MHGIGFGVLILAFGLFFYMRHQAKIKRQVILEAKETKVEDHEAQKELQKPVKVD